MSTSALPAPSFADAIVPASAPAASVPRARVHALDVFRLVATVLMVQGHVFTLSVRPAIRATPVYAWHDFVHGFTAPIFLFAAGLAFGVTTLAAAEPRSLVHRLERYGTILLVGYVLHLGRHVLSSLGLLSRPELARVLLVDALQCTGVTLLSAQLLLAAVRRERVFLGLVALVASALVVLAPFVERTGTGGLPLFLAAYVDRSTGSLFPLVPWAAYLLVGILVSRLVDPRAPAWENARRVGALAGLTFALGMIGTSLDPAWFGPHDYWRSSPFFFLARLGVLLALLAILFVVRSGAGLAERPLTSVLAQETLAIYVVHLSILYGTPITRSLRRFVEGRLDLVQASLLFVAVALVSAAVALGFARLKRRRGRAVDRARRTFLAAFLLRFFLA